MRQSTALQRSESAAMAILGARLRLLVPRSRDPIRYVAIYRMNSRCISSTTRLSNVPSWPAPPVPQPPVGPSDDLGQGDKKRPNSKPDESVWHSWMTSPSFHAALTTVIGLAMVFGAGIGYLEWYKQHVLHRVRTRVECMLIYR